MTVEQAGVQDGSGQEGRHQSDLFYADDVMISSSDPGLMKGYFRTLIRLFDCVGLIMNVGKTVEVVYCTCQAEGSQSEAAYER